MKVSNDQLERALAQVKKNAAFHARQSQKVRKELSDMYARGINSFNPEDWPEEERAKRGL